MTKKLTQEIMSKFNGRNAVELAASYQISLRQFYRLLRADHERTETMTVMNVKKVLSNREGCQYLQKNPKVILTLLKRVLKGFYAARQPL